MALHSLFSIHRYFEVNAFSVLFFTPFTCFSYAHSIQIVKILWKCVGDKKLCSPFQVIHGLRSVFCCIIYLFFNI
jgi:hypothetical protein